MSKNPMTTREDAALAVTEMFGGDTGIQIPIDAPLPQVKILRESPQFELPDGETTKQVIANILYWHECNAYYDQPFGEGESNIPKCVSSNGINPDGGTEPEPGPCRQCPFNEYGSAEQGRGKACTNMIRLYLMAENDVLPSVLRAPPSSLGNKESLRRWLVNAANVAAKAGIGTKYQPIIVKFTLHRKDFDSGMSASVLDLETVRVLVPSSDEDEEYLRFLAKWFKELQTSYIATGRHKEEMEAEVQESDDDIPI